MAASSALPPAAKTARPASAANTCGAATIPRVARASGQRVGAITRAIIPPPAFRAGCPYFCNFHLTEERRCWLGRRRNHSLITHRAPQLRGENMLHVAPMVRALRPLIMVGMLVIAASLAASESEAAGPYILVDLGTLGGSFSEARGINGV